ncbi:MAG: hypothetical protein ACLSUW_00455 [Akkermansia sp.]
MIPHAVRDVADAAAAFSARIGPDRHFDSQKDVEEALEECCTPQNVTVIGLTGSGKSSTLDALAGDYFCSRVSSEATLVRWQYRPHPPHTPMNGFWTFLPVGRPAQPGVLGYHRPGTGGCPQKAEAHRS